MNCFPSLTSRTFSRLNLREVLAIVVGIEQRTNQPLEQRNKHIHEKTKSTATTEAHSLSGKRFTDHVHGYRSMQMST